MASKATTDFQRLLQKPTMAEVIHTLLPGGRREADLRTPMRRFATALCCCWRPSRGVAADDSEEEADSVLQSLSHEAIAELKQRVDKAFDTSSRPKSMGAKGCAGAAGRLVLRAAAAPTPGVQGMTYTVVSGDTLGIITGSINACHGVTQPQILALNPGLNPDRLQIGQSLAVPVGAYAALVYTVQPGDSYYAIATNVAACSTVTASQLQAANPGVRELSPGTKLAVPNAKGAPTVVYTAQANDTFDTVAGGFNACGAHLTYQWLMAVNPNIPPTALQAGATVFVPPGPQTPAENIGYWAWSWMTCLAPRGSTMALAFSGFTDPDSALEASEHTARTMVGGLKFLTLGGGNANGRWSAASLASVKAAIQARKFSAYQGLAYDVEEGDSGLAQAFAESFALARQAGLKVMVTVSHSAPFGVSDADALMSEFLQDSNVDYLSPQLYTSGTEKHNDWATTKGTKTTWESYAQAKAAVVPSIVSPRLAPDAKETFQKKYGVRTQGYIVWASYV